MIHSKICILVVLALISVLRSEGVSEIAFDDKRKKQSNLRGRAPTKLKSYSALHHHGAGARSTGLPRSRQRGAAVASSAGRLPRAGPEASSYSVLDKRMMEHTNQNRWSELVKRIKKKQGPAAPASAVKRGHLPENEQSLDKWNRFKSYEFSKHKPPQYGPNSDIAKKFPSSEYMDQNQLKYMKYRSGPDKPYAMETGKVYDSSLKKQGLSK